MPIGKPFEFGIFPYGLERGYSMRREVNVKKILGFLYVIGGLQIAALLVMLILTCCVATCRSL